MPTILLVEDEPTVSKVVGKLLEEAGYEHVSIADHNQIAASIERWKPQCIILDSDPGSPGHFRRDHARGHTVSHRAVKAPRRAIPVAMRLLALLHLRGSISGTIFRDRRIE